MPWFPFIFSFSVGLSAFAFSLFPGTLHAQPLHLEHFKEKAPRCIGPAGMSGRVTAIDVDLSNQAIIYVGTASGGVWKSQNNGVSWKPIFEDQPVQAIGAVAINQKNPAEIWVGTGEGNPRNSHNSGLGIFKSLDAGATWKQLGLEKTRLIHRIRVNPHQPDEVYVAALGSAWGPNPERGVFKTINGGESWERILFLNDSTGCAELVMDPTNPNKLIAAMWEFGRKPWTFKSGGKGSGLWLTYDGGGSWKQITEKNGLPKGELGRIGLAIAPGKPNIVYALVEAKENAVYKSTDGGENWSKISEDKQAGNRPFYYSEIYVDPSNENRIFSLWTYLSRSEDGGKTWQNLLPNNWFGGIHPDHHALWIHPDNPDFMIEGNDGGLNISHDRGATWQFADNIPVAQFYHINHDMETPYNVGGGMQDNGSWVGPSKVWQYGGIRNHHWQEVNFGDGFDVVFKPEDARYVYAMSQGGHVSYIDRETGKSTFIQPKHPDGIKLRFNWDAAIAQNPFLDCGVYYGSQFLHKSIDCGINWEVISPDLTTNDTVKQKAVQNSGGLTPDVTDAENYTTILAIAPSPIDSLVIWVGTDDGHLQLTQDGGQTWERKDKRLPDFPDGAWIPQIEVSKKQAGEAFVVVNDYRRNNFRPYLYHTTNFGKSWKNLTESAKIEGFCRSVVQDPVESRLLFLGTEQGLYFSLDYGQSWQKWDQGFPSVPVSDLKIHPREHDLIIGTFGRSAWIMDDIRFLRTIAGKGKDLLKNTMIVFPATNGIKASMKSVNGGRFVADGAFVGQNEDNRVKIPVWIGFPEKGLEKGEGKKEDKVAIVVYDGKGDTLRNYTVKVDTGLQVISWWMDANGLRYPSRRDRKEDADPAGGAMVLPGTYKIVLQYKGVKDSTTATIISDPRLPFSESAILAAEASKNLVYALVREADKMMEALKKSKAAISLIESAMKNQKDTLSKDIIKMGKELQPKLDSLMDLFVGPEGRKGYAPEVDNANSFFRSAVNAIDEMEGRASNTARYAVSQAEAFFQKTQEATNRFFENEWKTYQDLVRKVEVDWFAD